MRMFLFVWSQEGSRGYVFMATLPVWTQKAHEDVCVAHEAFRMLDMCYEFRKACAFHEIDNVFHLCIRGPVQARDVLTFEAQ